ncbi:MAG: phosphate ABC transporter permease subunit PstC [Alphaproteobacteria bacterium]
MSSRPDRNGGSATRDPLRVVLWGVAAAVGAVVVLIVAVVVGEALPALRAVGLARFLGDPSWHPASGRYNLLPMIAGTFLAAGGALALACPLALLSAVFAAFFGPPLLATAYLRMIELLAGVPSVVFGFWGLTVLVPLIAKLAPPGASLLAAVLVLALMILPTITLIAAMSLRAVPKTYIRAAGALGFSRLSTIVRIVIPAARRGLAAGIVLGAARAVGETMAVLMVAGNVVQLPGSPFDPIRTLSANIALEIAYAVDLHRSALFVSGAIMIAFVLSATIALEVLAPQRADAS